MHLTLNTPHVLRTITVVTAFGLGAISAQPAMAQDEEPTYVIEEIVVTSQKREENLQEVPMAITALSESMIEDRGIKNVEDLFSSVPGVVGFEAVSTRGNIGVNLRGIGSGNPNNISIDPANALYVDGVYLGKAAGIGVDNHDLQRIEVLKGPQGTLYGRNSTGGAVNFITKKPLGEFGLQAQVTAGSESLQEYGLRVDLPAMGPVSLAVSGKTRERDPLYGNTNPNSEGFENIDRQGARFSANFDAGGIFTADYSFDYNKIDENTQALGISGFNPLGGGVLVAPGFDTNVSIQSGDRIAAVAATQAGLPFLGPAFMTPEVQQLNQWMTDYIAWATPKVGNPQSRKGLVGSTDSLHVSENEVTGHALTLAWDLSDLGPLGSAELKSITGYREVENRNESDIDGIDGTMRDAGGGLTTGVIGDLPLLTIGGLFFGQVDPNVPAATQFAVGQWLVNGINNRGRAETFNTFITADYEQFSQELQLVGSTDSVDYAFGFFYFDDEGERRGNSTPLYPIAFSNVTAFDNATTAWSLYSQVTWRPGGDSPFAITGGLRYTEEEKEILYLWRSSEDPFGFFGPFFRGETPDATYADNDVAHLQPEVPGIFGRAFEQDFDNVSGKITLEYDLSDFGNAFFTYSTGYRSGGFNGDAFDTFNNTADAFDEETIDNIELGVKTDLLDGRMRLNATYFDFSYDDLQVSTLLARPDGTVTSATDNSGKAERSGFELDLQLLPTDNLLLGLSYTFMDGDFEEYPPRIAEGGAILPTSDLARRTLMPDNQITWNIDWTILENNSGLLQLNVNGSWQEAAVPIAINGATYDTTGDRIPDTPVVFEQLENQERTLVNARLAWNEFPVGNGSLAIGLWGRNLLDEDYRNFSFNYGTSIALSVAQYGVGRTYGLDLIYRY